MDAVLGDEKLVKQRPINISSSLEFTVTFPNNLFIKVST
jgi:hypothetical protein